MHVASPLRKLLIALAVCPALGATTASTLVFGISGAAASVVQEIQTNLRRLGHSVGVIDGKPGPRTAAAVEAAREHCPGGFRLISNSGYDGMQSQEHAHVHILGGQFLGEYA